MTIHWEKRLDLINRLKHGETEEEILQEKIRPAEERYHQMASHITMSIEQRTAQVATTLGAWTEQLVQNEMEDPVIKTLHHEIAEAEECLEKIRRLSNQLQTQLKMSQTEIREIKEQNDLLKKEHGRLQQLYRSISRQQTYLSSFVCDVGNRAGESFNTQRAVHLPSSHRLIFHKTIPQEHES